MVHGLPKKWDSILFSQPIRAGNGHRKEKTKCICWICEVTVNAEYLSDPAARFSWGDPLLPRMYIYGAVLFKMETQTGSP